MRTASSSSRHWVGVSTPPLEQAPPLAANPSPLAAGTLEQAPPLAADPPPPWQQTSLLPGSRHPPHGVGTLPPGVGLETPWSDPPQLPPWLGAWRHPLNFPPGCWPGNLQGMLGYHPHPPPPTPRDLLQGMLGYHLQCMLG